MQGTWQTTSGGGGGGAGGGGGIGVIVLIIAGGALLGPVLAGMASAVASFVYTALITVAVVAGVAVVGGVAVIGWRVTHRRPRALPPTAWRAEVQPPPARRVASKPVAAVEAPREVHLHFHGVQAEDVAELVRRHQDG